MSSYSSANGFFGAVGSAGSELRVRWLMRVVVIVQELPALGAIPVKLGKPPTLYTFYKLPFPAQMVTYLQTK
jgi:hypothetical protein